MTFADLWTELEPVGRDRRTGGYHRFAWSDADLTMREWFAAAARHRGLAVETDRNGNQWAWWGDPAAHDVLAIGSHLDSVPDGGAFDGPLGVVSAVAALDELRTAGRVPVRPVAVVAFADEEGARFGVACAGSRLLTGTLDPDRARALRDADGTTLDEAVRRGGHDPRHLGADRDRLARLGAYVELHVEQGRGLADLGAPVGIGESIWPHGRWRLDLAGEANHAGTTRLEDRDDPMLAYARAVLAARSEAERRGVRATIGKVSVRPGGVNAIPSHVTAWLDARGADESAVRRLVEVVGAGAEVTEESWTPATDFDPRLRDRISVLLGGAPVLPTGAGHDAGVLATAGVPSAMLFVRNPTGVSHSPAEHADTEDCLAGVDALVRVVEDLACRPPTEEP
ncbi:MAG TPA: allantoate amidohydrolase [Jiangellales bacterium]|nr:allantoate amidohydrolase [Jiangellales bacterium]